MEVALNNNENDMMKKAENRIVMIKMKCRNLETSRITHRSEDNVDCILMFCARTDLFNT